MKKFAVFLLLLVAVVGLAVPYVIGGIAERQISGIASRMAQNSTFQIKQTSFQRGLFSSTATHEISYVPPDGKKPLVIRMRSVIHYGPFAGTLRHVTITSVPVLPPEYQKALAPMYGGKPFFTIVATRGNAGDWKIALHSPSFDMQKKDQSMQWQGVEALETVHGNTFAFKANMPGGKFSGSGADVTIGAIKMSANGKLRPHGSNLADATFDTTVASLSMKNAAGGDDKSFNATGLQLHQWQEPVATGARSYVTVLSAADLKIGHGIHSANPRLSMRLDNIDQAAIEAVSSSLNALKRKHMKPEDLQKQLFAALNAQLPKFLARSPKATVALDAGTLMVQSDMAGSGQPFVANGFHASEEFQVDGNQTLAYGLEFSADTLKAHGHEPVTDAKVGLRLENIYWGFLKELVPQLEALEKQHLVPALLQQREQALFTEYLPKILSHSPSLRLMALKFSVHSGELQADGEAKFDGNGNLNLGDKAAMMKRINAHLEVAVDAPLARDIALTALTAQYKKAAQLSGKAPQPVTAQMAEGMLLNLQRQGLLVSDGEQYGTHADLKNAGVFVNGMQVADLGKYE